MKESTRSTLVSVGKVLMLFGVVCYLTSCVMDMNTGLEVNETLPATGGTIGPVQVEEPNTVLHFTIRQTIDQGGSTFKRWSFITTEVLNKEKQYLTGFGGELWHEAGYNSEYWRESKHSFNAKMTLPDAGTYYFRFKQESDVQPSELSQIKVEMAGDLGSSLPHYVAGILGLILGAFLWVRGKARSTEEV
ncbi:MAG: hypothetical protein ABEL04_00180 [Salinibacter sp.]|uniref:hypothetical protein n=1 Tax=Salinibacter sp. TaxID=2065818 RepID=UPI0035D4E975